MSKRIATLAALAAFTTTSNAQILGFLEDFNTDSAGWRNFAGTTDLEWINSGGPDASPYASSTYNLSLASGMFPPTVIRAHATYPSSGGAYVGDWISAGVTGVSFSFRHDLSEAIILGGRFATPNNQQGASVITSFAVEPNTWTTVTYDLTPDSTDIISFGSGSYGSIFSNVGNIQLGFYVPAGLAGQNIDVRFDIDNFAIVPAPGTVALGMMGALAATRRRR